MSAQASSDAGESPIPTQQPAPHRSESETEREHRNAPLTGPLGKCCTRTVPHSGVARGTVEVIAGLATYVARPRPGPESEGGEGGEGRKEKKVILYFADVFGPLYINSKLAMDYWAAHGTSSTLR